MYNKIITGVILGLIVAYIPTIPSDTIQYIAVAETDTIDPLEQWIEKLIEYECRDCPEDTKILDVNGLYSYSCLQFQMPTFLEQKDIYMPHLTSDDIYSCDVQRELAYKMLTDKHENWRRWYNSVYVRGLGLPPKIITLPQQHNNI